MRRFREVTPSEVAAMPKSRVRIIDVREPFEFTGELGHVAGAELVPLPMVGATASAWPRDDEIVLVCRSGARSGRAAGQLAEMGFTHVMNMAGGMMAWNHARLPTVRS